MAAVIKACHVDISRRIRGFVMQTATDFTGYQPEAEPQAPMVRNTVARDQFRSAARRFSLDPDNRWVGGYVDLQWDRGRHVFECSGIPIVRAEALEFGCNIGATSIVLAVLGAHVTAVDIDSRYVELARLNAASYGVEDRIDFLHLTDTTRLPFPDGFF